MPQVVLDDVHYRSLLLESTIPPARARSLDAGLVKMGFPHSGAADGSANDSAINADPPITVCMWWVIFCVMQLTTFLTLREYGGHNGLKRMKEKEVMSHRYQKRDKVARPIF